MLRIALPNKGRLADETRDLFGDAGLEIRSIGERALTASLGGEFHALFVRAQDIPEFVADGAADAGITGWDLVIESERELTAIVDLGFGQCRLVVAVREDSPISRVEEISPGARVATVFPRATRAYFKSRHQEIEVVPVSGAVEVAPHLGIADVVVDITSTGSTLRVNGLRELDTIFHSTARLVASSARETLRRHASGLEVLTAALESVLRARGKRYLMANVPKTAMARVKEALKSLGAEGILVTRIERLMP
jgi:ATP phosphoribosyltransferase